MENFVVSARKYRPSTFDMVVGQSSITTTLKNAIKNNQIAQAFLFCGPRGVGKTTCARILAKTINCTNLSPEVEPCNECEACLSFNVSASFNIHELDAASNNKVEDIRALVDQVRIPPQGVRYKVYIIDEVHMLSQAAFNAFLKTLEEPPSYAKFILATTEKHKILPTIISRCQVFDFKRIKVEDIAKQLLYVAKNESIDAEIDALHIIAQKADGSMRDALSIFDQIVSFSGNKITYQTVINNLNILDFDYYFKITDFILDGNVSGSLLLFNDIIENGFDGQYFLSGLAQHYRNLLIAQDPDTAKILETGESLKNKYIEQSSRCNSSFLLKSLEIFSSSDINYKESNNKRLLVELALTRTCAIMKKDDDLTGIVQQSDKDVSETTLPKTQIPVTDTPIKQKKTANVETLKTTEPKTKKNIINPENKSSLVSKMPVTVSIKDEFDKKTSFEDNMQQAQENLLEENFTKEDLQKIWNEYKIQFKETDLNLYTTLNSRNPELKDDFVIEFIVDNTIQQKTLNNILNQMHTFLSEKLKNYKIKLEIKVTESNTTVKPFTPDEKYKNFVEKNPSLEKLRDQLDLNLDI